MTVSDEEYNRMPLSEQARVMQEASRQDGQEISLHEGRQLASQYNAHRLQEMQDRQMTGAQAFADRQRGAGAMGMVGDGGISDRDAIPGLPGDEREPDMEAG